VTETSVEHLFDEFALRYVRGERPDVREYLERAGTERAELGGMLDRFLQAAPAREPSEEDAVLVQAALEGEPALLVLRQRRKLTFGTVVDALVKTLGLDPGKERKVGDYYHRLETGLLDPSGVSRRVWDALGDLLQANARSLAGRRPAHPPAPAASYRRTGGMVLYEMAEVAAPAATAEPDEIDMLFTAGD